MGEVGRIERQCGCAVDSTRRAAKTNTARMPDTLPIFHVVGFTGHRQLKDQTGVERVMHEILGGLRKEAGVEWLALSSVAAGSDILFAQAALGSGIGWEAVLPLPAAEFRNDFTETEW